MVHFNELIELHDLIDEGLLSDESRATLQDDLTEVERIGRRRQVNDQIYFLAIFAQFEIFIMEKCKEVIEEKNQPDRWEDKRPWDIIKVDELSLKKRMALLMESGKTDFNKIETYRRYRNDIAHGTLLDSSISFPTVAAELTELSRRL